MANKRHLHRMVEELSEEAVPAAAEALRAVRREHDPVAVALAAAPYDDEPVTDADRHAIREGRADIRAGRVIPHEEAKRRLGLR